MIRLAKIILMAVIATQLTGTLFAQTKKGPLAKEPPAKKKMQVDAGRLLTRDDIEYQGSFRVPKSPSGKLYFEYGGGGLCYNPVKDSLFLVGHAKDQMIFEISIPELRTGPLESLSYATLLQGPENIIARLPHNTLRGDLKVGGLLVDGERLIGSIYVYYDANGQAKESHFALSSLDLKSAKATGLFTVGEHGGGYVGGYMTEVPPAYRKSLGAPWLTGQAAIPIISRTSAGPCAYAFDPATLGNDPSPAQPLVRYPLANRLAKETTQNPLFNLTTSITGVVFPLDADCLLFFGAHGHGPYCYGDGKECNDSINDSKGPHAPPYEFQVWAYRAIDLLTVREGRRKPHEIRPYSVWTFELPGAAPARKIGSVAYDARNNRIFISHLNIDNARPAIHVYRVRERQPEAAATPQPAQ